MLIIGVFAFFLIGVIAIGSVLGGKKSKENGNMNETMQETVNQEDDGETLESLMNGIKYSTVKEEDLVKGQIVLNDETSLYDELPDIDKYPLVVQGENDIDIEVFTSGEKAGKDTDAWLIKTAEKLNQSALKTSNGKSVSLSVRSVPSGLAADYIIAGKSVPDLYTPSNEIFAKYASIKGGSLDLYNERLVGNTAGILVKKGSSYQSFESVIDTVISGNFNFGYTNPQTSASGANLLIELLKDFSSDGAIDNEDAVSTFEKFNKNIPYIAYTTQQMAASASNGMLDGMITEYQAYINDEALTAQYDFIPFGIRHDNPLYVVNPEQKSSEEMEAIKIINDYLMADESQSLATKYGFNANDAYQPTYTTDGTEILKAFEIYKQKKDAGKDIIAVFVADCSFSMEGEAMSQLKSSLSNGMQYINENNRIGLIAYSTNVSVVLPINQFDLNQKSYFKGALDQMSANGSTSTYEAVCVALNEILAEKEKYPDAKCMMFLLSDGFANGDLCREDIQKVVKDAEIPIFTIGYTKESDREELEKLSNINEAAYIDADSDDIVYKIKSLFNAQL